MKDPQRPGDHEEPEANAPAVDTDHGWIAWFTRNHVAANLLMASIIVIGLMSLTSVRTEVFPFADTYKISISVPYPGASPEEVEEGICKRIENELYGMEGITRLTASASEGAGTVIAEVMRDFEVQEVLDDVKTRIDSIDNFPEQARKPVVKEEIVSRSAIMVAVSGDIGERPLKAIGETIRDELMELPDISQVKLVSTRAYEISIEISEDALRRYGLSMDQVADAVRRSSLDLPGGTLRTSSGQIMLRSVGQRYKGEEFADILLMTRPDGTQIHIRDVGQVVDGFAEGDRITEIDGHRCVLVQVYRVGDQDVRQIVAATKRYVEKYRQRAQGGIELTLWQDETEMLDSRINLLTRNMLGGLGLVFVVLALFLRLKLAFWVALGIPVSFLGCAALMPVFDISLNMISLFAFLLVLGIVVDDAIVVGESVHSQRKQERDGILAAIRGAKLVHVPVTFGVLTTMAAFAPMLFMTDNARKLWMDIGLIVLGCLAFSMVESKLVLPAHLAHLKFDEDAPRNPIAKAWLFVRRLFTDSMDWFVRHVYRPLLDRALHNRYVTVTAAVTLLILTFSMVGMGYIKSIYFPVMEGDNVVATLSMPQGTAIEQTAGVVERLERKARELDAQLQGEHPGGQSPIRHIVTSVGSQPQREKMSQMAGGQGEAFGGSHMGEVNLQLWPAETRAISAGEIQRRWRELTGPVPDAEELSFTNDIFGTGKDVNIQLTGVDVSDLRAAAEAIKDWLRKRSGVSEVTDSFRGGKREVKLAIRPSAENLGLDMRSLARQVRQGFYGEEVQRIQRKGEDTKVMVRYPEEERQSLATLEDMRIRTPSGDEVPFATVAEADYGRGFATISRSDRARAISVTAKVDRKVVSANDLTEILANGDDTEPALLEDLLQRYPSLKGYTLEGENRDQLETQRSLRDGYQRILFLLYVLLAIPFRSYLQPLLIMSAIPFGFIGAILAHWMLGLQLSIMSAFGFVALTGVVINDNLVLVDYINRQRRAGVPLGVAVRQAGRFRFRPILLTSMTTFAGLTPLLLETSVQAMFLIPMAVSLAFGVVFATGVSLVLVPCFYLILEDLRRVLGRVRRFLFPPRTSG